MMRRPRTTQERRTSCLTGLDEGYKIRSKRNHKNLVHAWDDNEIQITRSWKAYRSNQWKSG